MRKIIYTIFLSVLICFFSCKNGEKNNLNTDRKKSQNLVSKHIIYKDTLKFLLDKALKVDTLEFDNWKPFLYIKSGNILSGKEKNAIIVNCPTDSTYRVELYTAKNNKWMKNDVINNIEAHPTQFYLNFEDYNFDGQKDIYLQKSASNGWSLSRGYLFTIDPLTKKLTEHTEVRDLANMKPNQKERIIYTDELNYSEQFRKINRRINKWENGKLISHGIDKSKETKY